MRQMDLPERKSSPTVFSVPFHKIAVIVNYLLRRGSIFLTMGYRG